MAALQFLKSQLDGFKFYSCEREVESNVYFFRTSLDKQIY